MSQPSFHLEQIFGSKTRARLLALFLQSQETPFYVRELTRKIDAQLNSVRREIKNLVDFGILLEQEHAAETPKPKTLSEKKKYYVVNKECPLYQDLRSLFKKVQVLLRQDFVKELEDRGTIDGLIFTGRFLDHLDIPTDILVIGSIDPSVLQKSIAGFEQDAGHEINYTLISREEYSYRRQIADRFLSTILERPKIVLIDRLQLATT